MSDPAGEFTAATWHADRLRVRRWQLEQWLAQRAQVARAESGLEHDRDWAAELRRFNSSLRQALGEPEADAPASSELGGGATPADRVAPWSDRPSAAPGGDDLTTRSPVDPLRPRFHYVAASGSESPLVSIVTPFFNPGARFRDTAASVFGQSLQAWEWVVVDDASTDAESVRVLSELAACEPRMRVVRRAHNGGPGAARNDGFAAARAPYLLQLDADDLLEPTAAEKWLWFLETHPQAGFVNAHTVNFGAVDGVWTRGFEAGAAFLERNFVGGRGLLRRAVIEATGGYDPTLPLALEDWDFWLRCAEAGYWGSTLEEALDWQHRRGTDAEQWPDWDGGERQFAARRRIQALHPGLRVETFPRLEQRWPQPFDQVASALPFRNPLAKSKPRLLLLVAWADVGGTDRFNLDLLDELAARGWEASVVTTLPSPDRWRDEYLRRTPDLFLLHRFLPAADAVRFLRYFLESRQPDVVLVSHSELGYQLLPSLRAWYPAAAYVDFLHILEPEWKSGGYPRQSVLAQSQLDRTIASSRQLAGWMVERGADPARVAVVYTGVDAAVCRPDAERRLRVRAELGLDVKVPVILFAGRFCAQKRPLVAIRTFAALAARGARFVALVAGDGEERAAVEELVESSGLSERVRLLGSRPSAQVRDLMSASDLFFMPSEREGISLALFEAMAAGLAVVVTDVGGQREVLSESCGVLLPAGEDVAAVERFAAALAGLLTDPERRSALGRAARQRVETLFPLARMGAEMASEIELARAAARNPARRPVIDDELAASWAQQVVELQRLTSLSDRLWHDLHRGDARLDAGRLARSTRMWRLLFATGLRLERILGATFRTARRLRRPW